MGLLFSSLLHGSPVQSKKANPSIGSSECVSRPDQQSKLLYVDVKWWISNPHEVNEPETAFSQGKRPRFITTDMWISVKPGHLDV